MHRTVVFAMMLLSMSASAAESDVLRQRMGAEVYERTGVSQLSKEQLSVLEAWVLANTETRATREGAGVEIAESQVRHEQEQDPEQPLTQKYVLVASLGKEEQRKADEAPDLIHSRIKGKFRGWRGGKTRFVLENGEVWQQRQTATFITNLDSPEVILRKQRFGYSMEVPALQRSVLVKRVR